MALSSAGTCRIARRLRTAHSLIASTDRWVREYLPPPGYNDHLDHHRNFIAAVRSRKPVVEDSSFGLRAAGPALLSNMSYFEQRVVNWDPQSMTVAKG